MLQQEKIKKSLIVAAIIIAGAMLFGVSQLRQARHITEQPSETHLAGTTLAFPVELRQLPPSSILSEEEIAKWQVYENKKIGFSFRYPPEPYFLHQDARGLKITISRTQKNAIAKDILFIEPAWGTAKAEALAADVELMQITLGKNTFLVFTKNIEEPFDTQYRRYFFPFFDSDQWIAFSHYTADDEIQKIIATILSTFALAP